jgi:hypothetical protein
MNLDRQIDELAREMTAAKADVSLRARVLARLDEPRRWTRVDPIAAVAVLAVVVAAAASAWWVRQSPQIDTPAVAAGNEPALPAPIEPTPTTDGTTQPEATKMPEVLRDVAAAQPPSEGHEAWRARALPALTVPPALAVPVIQPTAIAIPLLDVAPLGSKPLGLTPITSVVPITTGDQTGDS